MGDPLEVEAAARASELAAPFPSMAPPAAGPLEPALASEARARFGFDFAAVRVHAGPDADRRAQSEGARALAEGTDLYFAREQFAPHTAEGARLLAHELAHVVQHAGGAEGVFRDVRPEALGQASLHVTMNGLHVRPPPGQHFRSGSRMRRRMEWLIGRLTGACTDELADRAVRHLDSVFRGGLTLNQQRDTVAADEEAATETVASPPVAIALIEWLETQGRSVTLSASRRQLLRSAQLAHDAWDAWQAQPGRAREPPWYLQQVFLNQISRHGAALERYGTARAQHGAAAASTTAALESLMAEVQVPVRAVEAIRADRTLTAELGYRVLFTAPDSANPQPQPGFLVAFLAYADTRPEQAAMALVDRAARRTLLSNFVDFTRFGLLARSGATDQTMSRTPGRANRAPLDARMDVHPPLQAPYRATRGADYSFTVHLAFPDVFEAFAGYAYRWEVVRVPSTARSLDAARAPGSEPSSLDAMGSRLSRAARYHRADLARVVRDLGPVGLGAAHLVNANAILRYGGAILRTIVEHVTRSPENSPTIVFDQPGVYVVRVRAVPIQQGGALLRAASVAYMPVIVEDASVLAESDVTAQFDADRRRTARIMELRSQLSSATSFAGRAELEAELRDLETAAGGVGTLLAARLDAATARRREVPDGSPEARSLDREIEQLRQRIAMRRSRFGEGAIPSQVVGTFVSDLGNVVRLLLEVSWSGSEFVVSDVTTANSGLARRSGERQPAILAAVRAILEGPAGYGRGTAVIVVDGRSHTLRIEASLGSVLTEAVESLTTVAAVAAIAAAPFTGGASLSLLLPIGLVGAIPSGYRLVHRGIDGTLRLDLATAMDVVNIVGSVVGLAQVATPLRMVRLGRALMVTGIGLDGGNMLLMGAGLVQRIEELEDLPPSLRRAQLVMIVGEAMLNVGIAVGGALAHHTTEGRRSSRRSTDVPADAAPPVAASDPARVGRLREALPPELHGVPIIEDATLPGNTVRAVYENGRLELRVGPGARRGRVGAHANTLFFLRRFEGLIGGIRRLIDRALTRLGLHPGFGTEGFEARIEVRKLREIIADLRATERAAIERIRAHGGDPEVAGAALNREIAALEAQLRVHEANVGSFEPGRGFVASADTSAAARPGSARPRTETAGPTPPIDVTRRIADAQALPTPAERLAALESLGRELQSRIDAQTATAARIQANLDALVVQARALHDAPGAAGVARREREGPQLAADGRAAQAARAEAARALDALTSQRAALEPHLRRATHQANPAADVRVPGVCFAADTVVLTPDGPRAIASLEAGDRVHAWDERGRRVTARAVRAAHHGVTLTWIHVSVAGVTVRATAGHRFLRDGQRGFVAARDLWIGDRLQLAQGGTARVDALREEVLGVEAPTCNLTVEEDETFAVGPGLVVHNTPIATLGLGNYVLYIAQNPAFPGQYYVGITEPPLSVRQSHHRSENARRARELRAIQARRPLTPVEARRLHIFEFRATMVLHEHITGIRDVTQARYFEHYNIEYARLRHGEANVMNLRIDEVSASELERIRAIVAADPGLRPYC